MIPFIDIHCHIDLCKNIDEVIQNAKKSNVKIILTCGVNNITNRLTLQIAQQYPLVKACLGIYPSDALNMSEIELNNELEFIKLNKDKIIALGEVGLDLYESKSLEKQIIIFNKLISLAKQMNKPLIVHSRKAEKQVFEILKSQNPQKVLLHCFSGKKKLIPEATEKGWYFSIPASCKYNEQFQEIIKIVPITQLFAETDSPFLHPSKLKDNEPANVLESYRKIAELKKISLEQVKKQLNENFQRLFYL